MKKFNFKKISAIGASVLMTTLTMGIAAAASYPAPFVDGGVANVAIVYGTGAGVSSLDMVQAGNIQTSLGSSVTGETIVTGGDSYKFEKTSTKFQLGDTITGVISSSLDDDELPTLLADGKYIDDDNDEIDYTQKITMTTSQLTMFEDNDYAEDEPTVGFRFASGDTIMTYTLTFDDTLLVTDMPTTDLPIMGTTYYVLSNTTTTLTLLDSATETTLGEGETATIDGKTVSIDFIGSSTVKLNVDGEITNTLSALDTFKLTDGTYVGIKTINTQDYQGGIKRVEFSLGSGKLKITDGSDVQINDNAISGLVGTLNDAANVATSLTLAWSADDDLFVTEGTSITMPGFEEVSLSFGGLTYPAEETIEVKQGGDLYATLENFPLKDGEADINFLYATASGTFVGFGKDANNRLVTAADSTALTYDKDTDDYFVISWSDGSDAESYLARFTNFVLAGSTNKTDLEYYKAGAWTKKKEGAKDADVISLGNAEVTISSVNRTEKTVVVTPSASTNFNKLYSEEGATVYLPYTVNGNASAQGEINFSANAFNQLNAAGHNSTSFHLVMREEDKSENKYSGDWINMTIGWDSSSTAEVEVSAVNTSNFDTTSTEIGETDVWREFTYSALATEILYDKPSSGQRSVKLVYHGDEVAAEVLISSADAVTTAGALGDVLVKDSEVTSVASKNLVIVGGSCINSAAATALNVAEHTCGAAFTEATGVATGEFLIKGVQDAFSTGKLALVVAGYDAADTVNAATYLTMKPVDTAKEYKGTTATEATLITA